MTELRPDPSTTESSRSPSPDAASRRTQLPRRRVRRAIYSLIAVVIVLTIGAVGFHFIAGLGPVDSLYFECMLATGQGPPLVLTSDAAKLFASLMAFLSIGTVLTTLVLNLGPVMGQLWREGIESAEHELRKVEREVVDEFKDRGRHP
jgi:hypothetical protein